MEFLEIEESRVVYLVRVRRPAGQLYMPEAAAKLAERYSFARIPTLNDLTEPRDYIGFRVGKFADSQIEELRIYSDGFLVEARSNSNILDAFIDDLVEWSEKDLGLEKIPNITPERYHESSLIVKSSRDLASVVNIPSEVEDELNNFLQKEAYPARTFQVTGVILDGDGQVEGGKRKEAKFILDRRVGVAFSENVFFSQAPLTTDAHLALLKRIERLAR